MVSPQRAQPVACAIAAATPILDECTERLRLAASAGEAVSDVSTSTSPAAQPSTPASGTPTPALGANTAGSGGGLPITGAPAGTIAGVAALLLAAGVVLFLMSRRRKVKFIS
jgi:hypothetical protein